MAETVSAKQRIRWLTATAALCCALVAALAGAAQATTLGEATQKTQVVVQLDPQVAPDVALRALEVTGAEIGPYLSVIHGAGALVSGAQLEALRALPEVRVVTLNAPVGPQKMPKPSSLRTAFNWSVSSPDAWSKVKATGKGVGVAVVDTGIAGHLPDFYVDEGLKKSRVVASVTTNPYATTANDLYGHGTHVAGIIAGNAMNRDPGDPLKGAYAGVAPDASLINVKVSDDRGAASVLDVLYGLQFVADHAKTYNIRVVNLSLQSSEARSYMEDPLDAAVESLWFKGIVVVSAAGNSGSAPDAVSYAPGNDPYIITVGAVDDAGTAGAGDDFLTSWSSRGTTQDGFAKPEVLAPGARIVSNLAPRSAFAEMCPSCLVDGEYIRAGGTSMAAPMVAGIVADLLQSKPGLTPNDVKALLIENSRTVVGGAFEAQNYATLADNYQSTAANRGLTPSPLLDASTGEIDYTASRWSASRWSSASSPSWGGDGWKCDCSLDSSGSVDPSASRWSASRWSTEWDK